MLDKQHRLKKNKHFSFIYKHGNIKHGKCLSVVYLKTKFKPFKVGFTVSKKIGKSVVRSKVKRLLRESFKELMPNVNPNYNYVFISREEISKLTHDEIRESMKNVLQKANLYENDK